MKLFDSSFESLIESLKEHPEKWEYSENEYGLHTIGFKSYPYKGDGVRIFTEGGFLQYEITHPKRIKLSLMQKITLRPYVLYFKSMSVNNNANDADNLLKLNLTKIGESNE